jgi:hypothetical protein
MSHDPSMSKTDHILREILHELKQIKRILSPSTITSFTIEENPMSLLPIAPGFTPGFTATPAPAGTAPAAGNPVAWTSSDTVNAPVTVNSSNSLLATVAVPASAVVGTNFTLSVSYTNADGTTAIGSQSFTIVAAPSPDITSFTISQTT